MFARSFVAFFLLVSLVGQLSAAPIKSPITPLPAFLGEAAGGDPASQFQVAPLRTKPSRFAGTKARFQAAKHTLGGIPNSVATKFKGALGRAKTAAGRFLPGHRKTAVAAGAVGAGTALSSQEEPLPGDLNEEDGLPGY